MRIAEVIGQGAVKRILLRLLRKGCFPHALALEGRRGTGRSTLCLAAAQALLCASPDEHGDACGHCPQCRLAAAGTHPDLVVFERSQQAYKADNIRAQLVDEAWISPLQAERRVFVLPDIELLRPASANIMLKILEEPPAGSFMLMTKIPGRVVLPTILSRVQVLRCAPLVVDDVQRLLLARGCEPDEARRLAALSRGSHVGLVDGGGLDDCPLDELFSLLHEEPSQGRIAAVVQHLPRHSADPGFTDAAWQRLVCERWFDLLVADIRQRLRAGAAHRLADDLERVLRVRSGLRLNFSPRQVLEQLAYVA